MNEVEKIKVRNVILRAAIKDAYALLARNASAVPFFEMYDSVMEARDILQEAIQTTED